MNRFHVVYLPTSLIILLALFGSACADKKITSGPMTLERRDGGYLAVYTPTFQLDAVKGNEFLATIWFLSAAEGHSLDTEIANWFEGTLYQSPLDKRTNYFSTVSDQGGHFQGYRFMEYDMDGKFIRSGEQLQFQFIGPTNDSIDWKLLRPKARLSAAIAIFDGNMLVKNFVRFLTPVDSLEFSPKT